VLRISVRDDGRGGADPQSGSGLLGLKDRVQALGGRLWLHSPPGTTLRAELPLRQSPAPQRWFGCSSQPAAQPTLTH
jgi:glucose-6-phosphate-specific signal transduction histidine kinase